MIYYEYFVILNWFLSLTVRHKMDANFKSVMMGKNTLLQEITQDWSSIQKLLLRVCINFLIIFSYKELLVGYLCLWVLFCILIRPLFYEYARKKCININLRPDLRAEDGESKPLWPQAETEFVGIRLSMRGPPYT